MRQPPRPRRGADPLALDDATVDRLLTGTLPAAGAPPGYARVAEVLAAMAAPPTPRELAGQAAVLAELRAVTRARRSAATRRTRPPRQRRRVGLAVVVVAGALATGGVAAAATGHLAEPVRNATRSILAGPAAEPVTTTTPASATPAAGSGGIGRAGPASTGAPGRGPGPTGAGALVGPDLERLCQAYLSGNGGEQGQKLEAAAFRALATAAGGTDKVNGFCEALLPPEAKPKKDMDPRNQDPPNSGNEGQSGPPTSTGSGTGGGGKGRSAPSVTPS